MNERRNEETAPPANQEKMDSTEQGRTAGVAQNDTGEAADISQVDQQEGQMNNGELGGNFEIAPEATPK